jgi:ribosomal protein L16 Arg81 hydroxylase
MGEKENPAVLKTYAPGDFLYIPAKMPHFGGAKGVTEIQLHGIGPFEIMLATQS